MTLDEIALAIENKARERDMFILDMMPYGESGSARTAADRYRRLLWDAAEYVRVAAAIYRAAEVYDENT